MAAVSILKIHDLSFAGTYIKIGNVNVIDFMDNANPIDIQDTDVANIEWSCNGRMIRTIKPSAVIISVTVIPNSPSDEGLRKIWKEHFCNGGNVSIDVPNKPLTCTLKGQNNNVPEMQYTNGTCISGAAGVSANGQGKMGGNTYTFAFEKC